MGITCKYCGGELHSESEQSTWKCETCGMLQAIPRAGNEKKANYFNRANKLRMSGEFDRALSVYKAMAAEFPDEPEAFWGLCLCSYGVEYVRDYASGKYGPTCRIMGPLLITEDKNYLQACEKADPEALEIYRNEAESIARIQKRFQDIASEEDPYDVFICCKETADNKRTEDSIYAEEAYKALSGKGMKVFFSRASLAGKPEPFEPYIYAALSSSAVMLVMGTQYENLDDPRIKSEWKQYLAMMKADKIKTIIPCYKDLDEYDRPPELTRFKFMDMGKPGWVKELSDKVCELCEKG